VKFHQSYHLEQTRTPSSFSADFEHGRSCGGDCGRFFPITVHVIGV
jgi:hypothetical protein